MREGADCAVAGRGRIRTPMLAVLVPLGSWLMYRPRRTSVVAGRG